MWYVLLFYEMSPLYYYFNSLHMISNNIAAIVLHMIVYILYWHYVAGTTLFVTVALQTVKYRWPQVCGGWGVCAGMSVLPWLHKNICCQRNILLEILHYLFARTHLKTNGEGERERERARAYRHIKHTRKTNQNTSPVLIELKISSCDLIKYRPPTRSCTQEASPLSISIPLLLTPLKIPGMDRACDAISCNINLWGWRKGLVCVCVCLEAKEAQAGWSVFNSLGVLLALQKHLKRDPNDYTALPHPRSIFQNPLAVESRVYFAVVIHVHTVQLEEGALADCKGCHGGGP